ncbi:MAG: hypothetical protein HY286_05140 [Planctomycetes bacterium]|nr:hypothetical protein [Planctomycetota bacterium]
MINSDSDDTHPYAMFLTSDSEGAEPSRFDMNDSENTNRSPGAANREVPAKRKSTEGFPGETDIQEWIGILHNAALDTNKRIQLLKPCDENLPFPVRLARFVLRRAGETGGDDIKIRGEVLYSFRILPAADRPALHAELRNLCLALSKDNAPDSADASNISNWSISEAGPPPVELKTNASEWNSLHPFHRFCIREILTQGGRVAVATLVEHYNKSVVQASDAISPAHARTILNEASGWNVKSRLYKVGGGWGFAVERVPDGAPPEIIYLFSRRD